jgi:steroid 5-alpha reductase family enzyme
MNIYLESLLIVTAINLLFFIIAFTLKTDVVTDLSYTLSFILLSIYLLIVHAQSDPISLIVFFGVVLWALRLGGYLLTRILQMKVDHRFDDKRDSFLKFGAFWLLQAITVSVVMLPEIFLLAHRPDTIHPLSLTAGLILWAAGFIIESTADAQKSAFKQVHPKRLITTGLWKCSRHPNYFGEMLVWWGLALVILPYLEGLSYLVLLGPVFITLLLLFVSGIPLLEKSWKERYGDQQYYQEYIRKTPLLIPRRIR